MIEFMKILQFGVQKSLKITKVTFEVDGAVFRCLIEKYSSRSELRIRRCLLRKKFRIRKQILFFFEIFEKKGHEKNEKYENNYSLNWQIFTRKIKIHSTFWGFFLIPNSHLLHF